MTEDDVTGGNESKHVVGGTGVQDAAEDPETRTRIGADDRVEGQSQKAGDGVVAADALELAAEVDATLELARVTLEGDGVGELETAGELEGRADGVRGRRDRNRAGARGEGVIEADDAGVDGQTTRPAGVGRGEDEVAGAVLGQVIRQRREGEGGREGERPAQLYAQSVRGGVEVDDAAGGEGPGDIEASGGPAAIDSKGDGVAGMA